MLLLNYEEVEIDEDHQQLFDEMEFLHLIMMIILEAVEVVVEERVEDYQLVLFHLLNHFLFQLNLLLMLNEDKDRHDAKFILIISLLFI